LIAHRGKGGGESAMLREGDRRGKGGRRHRPQGEEEHVLLSERYNLLTRIGKKSNVDSKEVQEKGSRSPVQKSITSKRPVLTPPWKKREDK